MIGPLFYVNKGGCDPRCPKIMKYVQPVSKPLQYSEQTRELGEAPKEVGVVFVTRDQTPEGLQPGNRAFDFVAPLVPSQFAAVLCGASLPVAAMRTDQIDAARRQTLAERIAVSGFVVNQSRRLPLRRAAVDQTLDQIHFGGAGRFGVDAERHSVAVDEQHDLGSLAALGLANLGAPFFAGENVPSAIASSQLISPKSSSSSSNRAQAILKMPDSVQSRKRRQHVEKEGKDVGKSFQRAPLRSTHKMPSRQSRGCLRGRPPYRVGGFQGKRSLIRSHCLSVSCVLAPSWTPCLCRRTDGQYTNVNLIIRVSFHPDQRARLMPKCSVR